MKIMLADSAATKGDVIKSKENVYEIDLEVMDKMNMFWGNHLLCLGIFLKTLYIIQSSQNPKTMLNIGQCFCLEPKHQMTIK